MKKWEVAFLIAVMAGTVYNPLSASSATQAQVDTKEMLVLDFTGYNDKGKGHAHTFQETVLPDADLLGIGVHGILPDAWRKDAGYDAIIRAESAKDYERSVSQVYDLIKQDRTIIAFDVNEHGLPQQLRRDSPVLSVYSLLPNKIYHPAMVAAQVAEKWLQEHPNGRLILRGHSDGTYAESYIFDYLRKKELPPHAVILESPRQTYGDWVARHMLLLILCSSRLPLRMIFRENQLSIKATPTSRPTTGSICIYRAGEDLSQLTAL